MSAASAKRVSIGIGIFYIAIGILGFVPGVTVPAPEPGQGLLLGIFAVNPVHNLAHLLVGALAVYAGTSGNFPAPNRLLAGVFVLLVVLSVAAPAAEGLALNLADTGLHLVTAALTGYLGFFAGH